MAKSRSQKPKPKKAVRLFLLSLVLLEGLYVRHKIPQWIPDRFNTYGCSNVNNKYKPLFRRSTWNFEPYYSYRTDVPYVCRYILIGTMQSKPDRHLRLLSCYNDEINPRIFWHLLWCWWLFLANLKMHNFSAVSGSGFRWRRYYLEPVPVSCSCCIYLNKCLL